MELQQIRYFLAIHEHGSFSPRRTGLRCFAAGTDSGDQKIETEIGAPLLYREGKRLVLTELGRMVKPHLEQVLVGTQTAREIARTSRCCARLRYGSAS
ncbi:hypothetical protein LP415_09305 [Polaromonas sp. P1(28)-8]|nr:hypothetical protein LP415_09305 [Polaromonas sp. P1(28)-8]